MPNPLTQFSDWTTNHRKLAWFIFFVLVVAVVAIVLTPVFFIMPFKAQTPRILQVSFTMRSWSPFLTLVAAALVLAFAVALWRGGRWWGRIALVMLVLPALGATWLARQNHFEWMFNPLANPAYAKAVEASFVSYDDRVMAVTIGGESVAYPITIMAYHHLVDDTVGGTPITATY
jgi:hypothetical protein